MDLTQTDDDTLLSAYLDGELPADSTARLEERLASDTRLAARLEAMRASDGLASEFFGALDDQPMPESVTRLFAAHDDDVPDNVVPFPRRVVQQFGQMPVAIAASVALVAGFLLNDLLDEAPSVTNTADLVVAGRVGPDTALFDLLETVPGGQQRPLSAAASGEVILSFADSAGDYCRQIRIDGAERRTNGLACRRNGDWQFEALAYTAAQTRGTGFSPASDPSLAVVERVVDGLLGGGDILDAEAEISLISVSWKKNTE